MTLSCEPVGHACVTAAAAAATAACAAASAAERGETALHCPREASACAQQSLTTVDKSPRCPDAQGNHIVRRREPRSTLSQPERTGCLCALLLVVQALQSLLHTHQLALL